MKERAAAAATAAATTAAATTVAIAGDPPDDGETALQHVITTILKQPQDGPLAKALKWGGISEISDILILSQAEQDFLSFLGEDGVVSSLSIGHRNKLKAVKIYVSYCMAQGEPIVNWTEVTKAE